MLRRLRELQRHEEGQALVLAAISMLILTLTVLATLSITWAAAEKIRLQNAADSVAYTTAAHQARAMNFMAYTNRAMIVHYSAQMSLHAWLSYIACVALVAYSVAQLPIPYLSQFFQIMYQIVAFASKALDVILKFVTPILDGITYFLGLSQFAVHSAMQISLAGGGVANLALGAQTKYRTIPVAETLMNLGSVLSWRKAVSATALPWGTSTNEDKFHRALFTEITNSARHPWTAYGGGNGQIGPLLLPRRWNFSLNWGIFSVSAGKGARTEWGSHRPSSGGGFFGSLFNVTEEVFSADVFFIKFAAGIRGRSVSVQFNFGTWVSADRKLGGHAPAFGTDVQCRLPWPFGSLCQQILQAPLRPLTQAVNQFLAGASLFVGSKHTFHLGQAPFARYHPGGSGSQWNRPKGSDLFNQPPTLVMLHLPKAELVRGAGPLVGKYGVRIGTLTGANSKLDDQGRNRIQGAPKRGWKSETNFTPADDKPLPFADPGFVALSAAITYYHRPGDWREPPNLFNPFWGAKLMPVTDYPIIGNNPLANLFGNRLIVH